MIKELFFSAGFNLNEAQIAKFQHFLKLFQDWNSKLNLSAIKDEEGMVIKHFIDSVLILKVFNFESGQRLVDIGSGGGFPGLPLGIINSKLTITLIDSVGKKMKAVQAMAEELGLANVQTDVGRAEEFGHDQNFREQFDWATARAVAELPVLLEYLSPLVKIGGQIVAYKSGDYQEELNKSQSAQQKLQLKLVRTIEDELPENQGRRSFLIFQKIAPLSVEFPRAVGIPKKKPL